MKIAYVCDHCGQHFETEEECRAHEQHCSQVRMENRGWGTSAGRKPLRSRWDWPSRVGDVVPLDTELARGTWKVKADKRQATIGTAKLESAYAEMSRRIRQHMN